MNTRTTTIITYSILSLVGGFSFMLPDTLPSSARASQESASESTKIMGVVRDFASTHSDFNKTPAAGSGHVAGNVAGGLDGNSLPVYSGAGYKVATQWRDSASNPIPPHLYAKFFGQVGKIHVKEATTGPKHGTVDTYNSAAGPYGPSNKGGAPSYVVGAKMPSIGVPTSLSALPNQGTLTYSGTTTISSDIHCNTLNGSGTINISGNISILCENTFSLSTHAVVNLVGATSRLSLYLPNGGSSWNHVEFNKNTAKPARVVIYNLGTATFMIHNHAEVHATIVAPNGVVEISNHGTLFGRFIGKRIEYDNHGDFHVDGAASLDLCGNTLNDIAGASGAASTAAVSSFATFSQWFTDTLGQNLSSAHVIEMVKNAQGVYEYLDDAFHPIDNMLLGNEGQSHNHFFTYAFSAPFTHKACSGGFIEFEGADDLWLFIDGVLALDIGGVQPATRQRLDVSRLNLIDGVQYRIHVYYAQRNVNSSMFRLRTNLDLIEEYTEPSITAVGD